MPVLMAVSGKVWLPGLGRWGAPQKLSLPSPPHRARGLPLPSAHGHHLLCLGCALAFRTALLMPVYGLKRSLASPVEPLPQRFPPSSGHLRGHSITSLTLALQQPLGLAHRVICSLLNTAKASPGKQTQGFQVLGLQTMFLQFFPGDLDPKVD